MKKTTATATTKIYTTLFVKNKTLTADQIRSRFNVIDPHSLIRNLRKQGHDIVSTPMRKKAGRGRAPVRYSRG